MGQVRNIKSGKLLNPYDDGSGYLRVKIDGRCERLHILVATAFIPNPENKPIVNHKRGKKHDCRASQLEWVTQSENIQHAWDTGLFKSRGGKPTWQQKKTLKTKSKGGWKVKGYIHLEQSNRKSQSPPADIGKSGGAVDIPKRVCLICTLW